MELKMRSLRYFERIFETQATLESGGEMIVPDLYPDIARIIDTSGQACIKEKLLMDDRLEATGVIKAGVLYMPENANTLAKMDVSLPFSQTFDGHFPAEAQALCHVRLLSVDAHAVNPRKVQITASILVECRLFAPREVQICDNIEGSCEQLKSAWKAYMAIGVKEKPFSVMEELELSSNKPPVEDILKVDVRCAVSDAKPVGNKLVFKGVALVRLLYRSGEELCTVEQEFPFSQIMEMDGLEDGAMVDLDFMLAGLELDVRAVMNNEARTIAVSLYLEAQAIAYVERYIEAVADLYGVDRKLSPVFTPLSMTELVDKNVRRHAVREQIETGEDVSTVVDTQITLWPVSRREDGTLVCDAMVKVLYLNDAGQYGLVSRRIPVQCPVESGDNISAVARLAGDMMAMPSQDGLEARFSVDFDLTGTRGLQMMTITSVGEESPDEDSDRPSVVMRRCRDGETLWDIAKRYGATRNDLAAVNGLESFDALQPGKLLLIPRKR